MAAKRRRNIEPEGAVVAQTLDDAAVPGAVGRRQLRHRTCKNHIRHPITPSLQDARLVQTLDRRGNNLAADCASSRRFNRSCRNPLKTSRTDSESVGRKIAVLQILLSNTAQIAVTLQWGVRRLRCHTAITKGSRTAIIPIRRDGRLWKRTVPPPGPRARPGERHSSRAGRVSEALDRASHLQSDRSPDAPPHVIWRAHRLTRP